MIKNKRLILKTQLKEGESIDSISSIYKSANILGILKNKPNEWFSSLKESTISVEEIEKMIRDRNLARERKDYEKADLIRNQLLKENIVLEDKGSETIWKQK